MRLGLKLFLATVLAAVLVVPAAGAKPGNGNGGGNGGGGGKPAWAGGGGTGAAKAPTPAKAKGKPAWAGQGKAKKAEQAQRKLERRAATEEDPAEGEEQEGPLKDNPAFVCKFERDMMGAEAFAEAYGMNENLANAFGKCVSEEAQARDGAEGDDEEPAEAPAACEPTGEEPAEGEEPVEGDEPVEGECPEDEDTDSGEDVEDDSDGETDEGSEEDGDASTEEILAALRLLL